MSFQVFYKLKNSDYGEGLLLEKYNETFGVYAAQEPRETNGTIYKRWAFPQTKERQPGEKAIPMGIKLGNQTEAIEILKYFLEQLNASVEDDAPF
jgi:hypothetical protein